MGYKDDINKLHDMVKSYQSQPGYSRVYFCTNERLDQLYNSIDFKDKTVLSVLSSGDQVFMANYAGAKSVDCFDVNILTKYYYYLRVWTIKICGVFYPEQLLADDYEWLRKMLKYVKPKSKDEREAYKFWKNLWQNKFSFRGMLCNYNYNHNIMGDYFEKIHLEKYINSNINFYNIDIGDVINLDKKYDIVVLSNMLNWLGDNLDQMKQASQNVNKLLNDGGVALCSKFLYEENKWLERMCFDSNFQYDDIEGVKGYTYTKFSTRS